LEAAVGPTFNVGGNAIRGDRTNDGTGADLVVEATLLEKFALMLKVE